MRKAQYIVITVILVLMAQPASAEEISVQSAKNVAEARSINEGTRKFCRLLPAHAPDADVTYQPGVDVRGRAVVPADLNSANNPIVPEVVKIPLSVDLVEEFDLGEQFTDQALGAPLGLLEVYPDGRVLHQGNDLSNQAAVTCDGLPKPAEEEHGQVE